MSTAPLLQVTLGPEDRAELMRDLSAVAQVTSAQLADGGGTRACRLDEAFAALEDGSALRVLIRYRHEGRAWLDTLIPAPEGVRLVRIAEDPDLDQAGDDAGEG